MKTFFGIRAQIFRINVTEQNRVRFQETADDLTCDRDSLENHSFARGVMG